MARVVFDTVVFVRALIDPFSFCGRVVFAHYQDYSLVLSPPVATEIVEVIHRPELTAKLSTLMGLDIRRVLDIISGAQIVELGEIPAVSRDAKDDKFLATARAAAADYLVTEDQDLLVLDDYEGTRIVNCSSFLAILEQNLARE